MKMTSICILSKNDADGLVCANNSIRKYVSRIREILEHDVNLEQILLYLDIIENYTGHMGEILEDKDYKNIISAEIFYEKD